MVNQINLDRWIEDLRTTTAPQVKGRLARLVDEDRTVGYCCMGRACEVAGIHRDVTDHDGDGHFDYDEVSFYYDDAEELPPPSLYDWLGLPIDDKDDLSPDWPTGGDVIQTRSGRPVNLSCASLNDDGEFTFPQIADLLDYFGCRGA